MDIVPPPGSPPASPGARPAPETETETEAEHQVRLAWKAEDIAKADADIAAGRMVDEVEVDAWIDSIGTDHELPVPRARR